MAYEPGGGAGQPYDKSEDLMYTPGFSVQDYISHMMQQGNVGIAQPMGVGIPDFAQDQMYGRTPPSDLNMPGQGGPSTGPYDDNTDMGPDEFIQQQMARAGGGKNIPTYQPPVRGLPIAPPTVPMTRPHQWGPVFPDEYGERLPWPPGPLGETSPDDFINQQMAGDVVPTSRYLPAGQAQDIQRRMSNPDTVRGSMGQLSIDTMGGAKSPYIDLMDVLMGRIGTRR